MDFVKVEVTYPPERETVLVRGWGEKKQHYVYALAQFLKTSAGQHWQDNADNRELWFMPHEWAVLPENGRNKG